MHIFACIQNTIVSLRIFNQQERLCYGRMNIMPTNENIHNITFLVVHILSGKAIAGSIRAHFIVDAALNVLILRRVLNAPLPCQPETTDDNDTDIAETADVGNSQYLDEARTLYEKLMTGNICAEEAYSCNVLEK